MSFVSITVMFSSLMYLGFGIAIFFFPVEVLSKAKIFLSDPIGIMEARSFYGGLEIGLGAFILYSYFVFEPLCPILLTLFLLSFTLLGRIYGYFIDSAASAYLIYALLIEGSIFVMNLISFLKLSKV
jgi:hypothetical protein